MLPLVFVDVFDEVAENGVVVFVEVVFVDGVSEEGTKVVLVLRAPQFQGTQELLTLGVQPQQGLVVLPEYLKPSVKGVDLEILLSFQQFNQESEAQLGVEDSL